MNSIKITYVSLNTLRSSNTFFSFVSTLAFRTNKTNITLNDLWCTWWEEFLRWSIDSYRFTNRTWNTNTSTDALLASSTLVKHSMYKRYYIWTLRKCPIYLLTTGPCPPWKPFEPCWPCWPFWPLSPWWPTMLDKKLEIWRDIRSKHKIRKQ